MSNMAFHLYNIYSNLNDTIINQCFILIIQIQILTFILHCHFLIRKYFSQQRSLTSEISNKYRA